nr:EOG090X0POW [Ilyocryptus agilis]
MTMDATVENGRDSSNTVSAKSQTPKRSFDVAFLTGISEAPSPPESEGRHGHSTLTSISSKDNGGNVETMHGSSGRSAFKKVNKNNSSAGSGVTNNHAGDTANNIHPMDLSLPAYQNPLVSFPAIATALSLQLLQQNTAKGLAMSLFSHPATAAVMAAQHMFVCSSFVVRVTSAPSQNVCAKCNLSFRMTSDLVYHMRSQHRRDATAADAVRQKQRQEKLRCPVCGENFRERHHLTRHMTQHYDKFSGERVVQKTVDQVLCMQMKQLCE